MRLLLIQRGAADFLRHCSLLHGYCSYPLGTSSPSLLSPLPSLSLSLSVSITWALPLSFTLSIFPPSSHFVQLFCASHPPHPSSFLPFPLTVSSATDKLRLLVFLHEHHKLAVNQSQLTHIMLAPLL